MNLKLSDKTAIVSAGSKGLGKAIALGLAMEGARVAICSRSPPTISPKRPRRFRPKPVQKCWRFQ